MAHTVSDFLLSSGFPMPAIGLGTGQCENEEELEVALRAAIESGYRHIDTAYLYGNETFIGRTLHNLIKEGKVKRSDLFIVTKLPPQGHEDVEYFCKKSLEALQLDYVDLYLIHSPMSIKRPTGGSDNSPDFRELYAMKYDVDHLKTWKAMENLVDSGLSHSIGISNFNSKQIRRILDNCRIKPAVLQVECHIYLPQLELHQFCKENNILITAYGPLGSPGLASFYKNKLGREVTFPRLLDEPKLHALAEKYSKNPSQIAMRYLVQRGVSIIPKSINPIRIMENIQIFDFSLAEGDVKELDYLKTKHRYYDMNMFEGMREHPAFPFIEEF